MKIYGLNNTRDRGRQCTSHIRGGRDTLLVVAATGTRPSVPTAYLRAIKRVHYRTYIHKATAQGRGA